MGPRDAADRTTPGRPPPKRARAAALGVHFFTASGVVLGFLALLDAVEGNFPAMFAWLGLALLVDGIDGALARKARVVENAPGVSGDTLDLVVDYVTYVLVPAYALAVSGVLPAGLGVPAAALICLTSALYFASTTMKTDDWHFRGFPAAWNVVAFYLFVLGPPPWIALGLVALFAGLTFAPIAVVHPFRVKRLRGLTLAMLALGAALAAVAVAQDLRPDIFVIAGLVGVALYFSGLSLSRPRDAPPGKG